VESERFLSRLRRHPEYKDQIAHVEQILARSVRDLKMNTINRREAQVVLAEWAEAVEALVHDVEQWCRDRGWATERSLGDVDEELLGVYQTPVLNIETDKGRLVLEPIARMVVGAEGRVDLYAWPTLFRVMLLYTSGHRTWTVRTDSGIDWPQPWQRDTFYALAEGLLRRP
jgi:hypothetical protein